MSKKTILVTLFLIITFIVIIVLSVLSQNKPAFFVPKNSFQIVDTSLKGKDLSVAGFIHITFSEPVDPTSFVYQISPKAETHVFFDSTNTLATIEATQNWDFNTTYTLVVKGETRNKNGHKLGRDQSFTFKTDQYKGF